jgi:hypothetical protein
MLPSKYNPIWIDASVLVAQAQNPNPRQDWIEKLLFCFARISWSDGKMMLVEC